MDLVSVQLPMRKLCKLFVSILQLMCHIFSTGTKEDQKNSGITMQWLLCVVTGGHWYGGSMGEKGYFEADGGLT